MELLLAVKKALTVSVVIRVSLQLTAVLQGLSLDVQSVSGLNDDCGRTTTDTQQ